MSDLLSASIRRLFSLSLHSPLTRREREILGLMALGMTDEEISSTLYITRKTMRMHARSLYARLGLTNAGGNRRVIAVLYAIRSGVVSTPAMLEPTREPA